MDTRTDITEPEIIDGNELPTLIAHQPALVFDAMAGFYQTPLQDALANQFQIIGLPGGVLVDEVQSGDIHIQRVLGEGMLAQAQRLEQEDISLYKMMPGQRLDTYSLLLREIDYPVYKSDTDFDYLFDTESAADQRHWFVPNKPVVQLANRNQVQFYVDGESYCTALYQDLLRARHHIYLTGLHFMADFGLIRSVSPWTTLADALLQKAQQGVRIYLIVNQFWEQERNMLGYWHNHEYHRFDTSTPIATQIQRAWADTTPPNDRRDQIYRDLENQIRPRIAEGGSIERYLPATVDLFRQLAGQQNIKCRTDIHPGHIMHSHHQKTVVIDDAIAYVGGIDLTHVDGDRWDNHNHSTRNRLTRNRDQRYWHDIHGRLEGHAAQFVAQNFQDRWRNGRLYQIVTRSLAPRPRQVIISRDVNNQSESFNRVNPTSERPRAYSEDEIRRFSAPKVQLVRSMPEGRNYITPSGNWERTAKDAYITGIRAARHSIYLENQWISDESIWEQLAQAAQRNRNNSNFRIVIMLPNEPLRAAGAGANQNLLTEFDIIKVLRSCRDSQTLSVFSLVNRDSHQIYVHSKMMIVDDMWTLIGSANAGGISLEGIRQFGALGGGNRPDTELSFITLDQTFAQNLRRTCWQDHLNNQSPGSNFNNGVRLMRQHADSQRQRIRHSPYLVNAFGGIDLRIFSYSDDELRRIIEAQGRQAIVQYVRALYRIYQQIDQQISAAAGEVQRQLYQRIRREIEAMITDLRDRIIRLVGSIF